jgi:hypothetical protein
MTHVRTLLFLLLLALPVRASELKTLKGETIKGDVVSVSAKEIVLDTGGGKKVATAVDQILSLTFIDPVPALGADVKYILVELTDGSQLKCAKLDMKGKDANLVLLDGQKVDLPIAKISYVLNEAENPAHVKALKEKVLARKSVRDILALKKGEIVNPVEGTLGDVDDKGEIEFILPDGGEKRSIPISRPVAIYFRRGADAGAKSVICRLHDTSRNLLFVSELKREGDGYTVVTSAGATVKYAQALVAKMDFSGGKLVYLSALAAASVKETSTEGTVQHYRKDENLEGNRIKLAGVEYPKGLALHATTELEYDLDGEYRELKGVVGIDDDIGGVDEPAILKIFGDGVELISWAVSRKDKERARNLSVSVKDVKRLRILVTSDDILDLGKHVTLADIRVSK